jgi:hypothetical protein
MPIKIPLLGGVVKEEGKTFQGVGKIVRKSLPGRTRTCDPQLRRLLLYPPELRGDDGVNGRARGRGERIRTSDPLLPKQVRYQTALHPDARGL